MVRDMEKQAFIDSIEQQTQRLCDEIADFEDGRRKVIMDGEDVSEDEVNKLRHQVMENMTILNRLRARELDRVS